VRSQLITYKKIVCDYYNIPLNLIQSKNQEKRDCTSTPGSNVLFEKVLLNLHLPLLEPKLEEKDHATVLHACKTVNNLIDTDKQFRLQIQDIEKKLSF